MNDKMLPDLLQRLRAPFPPEAIDWLPGSVSNGKCRAMAYADLRVYQERLDEVCGLAWSVTYTAWEEKIICHLTVDGVTRSSTGEPDAASARAENAGCVAEAQAFKRAAAMFGLGRYLYSLPAVWVEYDGKKITEAGQKELTARYRAWFDKFTQRKLAA